MIEHSFGSIRPDSIIRDWNCPDKSDYYSLPRDSCARSFRIEQRTGSIQQCFALILECRAFTDTPFLGTGLVFDSGASMSIEQSFGISSPLPAKKKRHAESSKSSPKSIRRSMIGTPPYHFIISKIIPVRRRVFISAIIGWHKYWRCRVHHGCVLS